MKHDGKEYEFLKKLIHVRIGFRESEFVVKEQATTSSVSRET